MKRLFLIFAACLLFGSTDMLCKMKWHKSHALKAVPAIDLVIVTPTYNNERYAIANIESVIRQSYKQWHMVIVNDRSTDATGSLLHNYIVEHKLEAQVTLIDNTERKGALRNFYETIHALPDDIVVINLDGDDTLYGTDALRRIAQEYANPEVWITYGSYRYLSTGNRGFGGALTAKHLKIAAAQAEKEGSFRNCEFITSHARTYKAWLFKKISREDLQYNGEFYSVAWDLAMMFPMLEMARKGHIRYIKDILYEYNDLNPINDHKKAPGLQQWYNQQIRKQKQYDGI